MTRFALVSSVCLLNACAFLEDLGSAPADRGDTADTATLVDDGEPGAPSAGPGGSSGASSGWLVRGHTCYGDGIDTMWWDADEQSVWIGCGSNTSGYGLHHSPDRGETWPELHTDPRGAADGRVNAVQRSSDGLLYVAGQQLLGGSVVALDTSTSTFIATSEYSEVGTLDDVQLAGSFARNDDGVAVVEALNGTQIAVRWSDDGRWEDASGWAGGASVQLQDLVVHDNQFYGTGSTMNDAPMVFLPPQAGHDEAAGFMLVVVELSMWAQELRSLDVDAAGAMVVGGVDHGVASGVAYVSGADPRSAADWTEVWLEDWLGDEPTWIDGVCRDGDQVALVGRYSTTDAPITLLSADAGATWSDLTTTLPADAPLYECTFLDDGQTLAVGGGSGFLGFYTL